MVADSAPNEIFPFMDAPTVLDCKDVYKDFKLPTEQATGLKQAVINWTKGIRGYKSQHVLKGITFSVHKGEFFGVVGRNGGGKSTLLKIISQIYYPNKGSVSVKGRLVPFIELGVGFNPELTGRENVYLNGAMLGFSKSEMNAMYESIVSFAELEDFMDQKLKNYSSGMQVRLAFAVAVKAQADVLVLDEVLAVGDESFQRKCNDYFTQIKKDPEKTVILVTHDMNAVKRYCTRAMLIKDGKIASIGDKNAVAEEYTLLNLEADRRLAAARNAKMENGKVWPEGLSERCPLLRTFAVSKPLIGSDEKFVFGVEYEFNEDNDFYLAIAINDVRRGGITYDSGAKTFRMTRKGRNTVYFSFPVNLFNNGEFTIYTSLRVPSVKDDGFTEMVGVATGDNACSFIVRDSRNADYALLSNRAVVITAKSEDVETLQWNGWKPGMKQVTAEAMRRAERTKDPLERMRAELLERIEEIEGIKLRILNEAKLEKLRKEKAEGVERVVPIAPGVLRRLSNVDLNGKVSQITLDDVILTQEDLKEITGSTEEARLIGQLNQINDEIVAKAEEEKEKK